MSLSAALGIASQSLGNINLGLAVVSNNVANASTAGYQTEQTTQWSLDAGATVMGARLGPTGLVTDAALQAAVYTQNGATAADVTTSTALANVQPVLGAVGQGTDLGSLLGALQNGFSALLNDPSSQTQQGTVVGAAQAVARQLNQMSAAYGAGRQAAQDALVGEVGQLNSALTRVGALNQKIVALQAQGLSTADLQNQRTQALGSIAGLVGARFSTQADGSVQVFTASGVQLPTDGVNTLSIAPATTGSAAFYPGGGLPGIMLGGADVSSGMTGGQIGANMTLRDQTFPTYQAETDEFAQTLAGRFQAQGLTLFSDPQGNVPAGGGNPAQTSYIGFSSVITVNPAVVAQPSEVRDGTAGAGGFTPNPNNLAGYQDQIVRVLDFALGSDSAAGVAQTAPLVAGLGPSGTLAAPFAAPATLGDFATAITASQSADSATASSNASDSQATQTSLTGNLKSETGVSMDSQLSLMLQLQNAYGANAKIIAAVQSMFTALFNAVQ